MKTISAVGIFALFLGACSTPSSSWRPAPGPLTTRWGRELDPDHVLAEYPRPQLERPAWRNLNGLWEFADSPADEPPPF